MGYPGAEGQGRLGIGDVNERMIELHDACAPYALDRPIMPVMELIATTVHPVPGPDGKIEAVLFGLGSNGDPFLAGKLATTLPAGVPSVATATKAGGLGAPRYGVKPTVMGRPAVV